MSCSREDLLSVPQSRARIREAVKTGPSSPTVYFCHVAAWSISFLDSKNKEDFSFPVVWLSPLWWLFVQVCVTERETTHTCEGKTDRLWATEAVTQCPSPSQPQELVLRTGGETGEGRVDRAASTSVAASEPEDRAQRPPRREASPSRHHEAWHRP